VTYVLWNLRKGTNFSSLHLSFWQKNGYLQLPLSTWQDRSSKLSNSTSVLVVFSAQDVYLHGRMFISEQKPAGISLCLQQNTKLVCTLWDLLHKLMGIQGMQSRKDEQS
jgi:hypothetical protein